MKSIYQILDIPAVYRLARKFLAPGAKEFYNTLLSGLLSELPKADKLIDVGCGPRSLLFDVGKYPIGIDPTKSYIAEYLSGGGSGVVASASTLPFPNDNFEGAWCIAVFHHLPDAIAKAAIQEMMRVVSPNGYVVLIDGVLPRAVWKRPIPWIIRRLDRGRFMRKQEALESLLPLLHEWEIERKTYTKSGMELVVCKWRKNSATSLT